MYKLDARDATRAYRRAMSLLGGVAAAGGDTVMYRSVGCGTSDEGIWCLASRSPESGWIVQPVAMPLRIISLAVSCTGVDAGQTKRAGSGELSFVFMRPLAWNVEKKLID